MFTNGILRLKWKPLLPRYSSKDVQIPSARVTVICNLHCLDILFEFVGQNELIRDKSSSVTYVLQVSPWLKNVMYGTVADTRYRHRHSIMSVMRKSR